MKIKKYLIIPVLSMTLMTGCGNKTFDKAMEEGKLAIASKEYEKAEGMFNLAIEEKKDDKEANALYNQIQKLIEAMKLKEEGKLEEVVVLCDDIEKIESKSEAIKKEANILKEECNTELKQIEEVKKAVETSLVEENKNQESSSKNNKNQTNKVEDNSSEMEYDPAEDPSTVAYEYRYGCHHCGELGHAMRECSNWEDWE